MLKAHGMAGATIAVKNYIGVMNTTKHDEWFGGWVDDYFHPQYCFSEYALVARELDICWPKLNIVDATWVATSSNYNHSLESINANAILASTDPVAVSWYAAKYILEPIATYPERVNPDYYGNNYYGTVLNYWYNYLADSTDHIVTKDSTEISVYSGTKAASPTYIKVNAKSTNLIKAFPNPSPNGVFNVEVSGNYFPKTVYVSNASGVIVEEILIHDCEFQIDLSGLPLGVYQLFSLGEDRINVRLIY